MNVLGESDAPAPGLRARVKRSWNRDRDLSVSQRLRKGMNYIAQLLRARGALRDCDQVGKNARVQGRLRIQNLGSIVIGDHVNMTSTWVPLELLTGPEGKIEIGDDVLINFGTVIAAANHISIGSGTMIGPHCIIADVDIPESVSGSLPMSARQIKIGKDVWLAGRVTLRPGVTLGDGVVVVAGSIVESDIPAHFMASGTPARLVPRLTGGVREAPQTAPVLTAHEIANLFVPKDPVPDNAPSLRGALLSDFRLDDLVNELRTADAAAPVHAIPYYGESLADAMSARLSEDACDFAVVWTRPETAVPSFARLLRGDAIRERDLLAEVDSFCRLLERGTQPFETVLVPTWTQPAHVRGRGYRDWREGGVSASLAAMNLRMVKNFEARANVFILDAARWQATVGATGFNARGWYLGRMAVSRALVAEAARDIRAALAAVSGTERRLLVLHADTALWGAPDLPDTAPLNEAHASLLRALSLLRSRGAMLAILGGASRFEVLAAIRAFPPGTPREDDFAGIDTEPGEQAVTLKVLAQRLGVKLDSVVYVDAREAVRTRIREAHPAVYVPEWPVDKFAYASALLDLSCFDARMDAVPAERRLGRA